MIKFLFKLPNNLLLKYLDNNIEILKEKDFFQLVAHNIVIPREFYQRNKEFINNTNILRWVIFNDPNSIFEFNPKLFTDDILDEVAISNITLTESLINQYPIFFTNQNMIERIIREFPFFIKKLKTEQITDNIIKNLILSNYILDEEDINKFPFLLDNLLLSNITLENNPKLVFKLPKLSESHILFIKNHGLIPTYDDYLKYPILKNDSSLIKKSFKEDVSCIVFMNDEVLDYYIAQEACDRGFVATEKDFILNPLLGKYKTIMEPAIMNNPALIVYTEFTCLISYECINYALKHFTITTDILEEYPDLCRNYDIIHNLPQFQNYSLYKTEEEKIADIVKYLEINDIEGLRNLPFLRKKYWSPSDIDEKIKLINLLYEKIKTDKMEDQKNHFYFLDKLIDGVCSIRYHEQKDKFEFGDIASLHNYIVTEFIKIQDKYSLILLVEKLSEFTGYEISKDKLKKQIFNLYNLFLSRHTSLLLSDTNVLCNKILNAHRNNFFKNERNRIVNELIYKLELTDKKQSVLNNRYRFPQIARLIKNKCYDELNTSEMELKNLIKQARIRFYNNRRLKKDGIVLSEELLDQLDQIFFENGVLKVSDLPSTIPLRSAKYICNNYEKIKLHFVDSISIENHKVSRKGINLNYNNFVIVPKNQNFIVLAKLILNLEEDKLKLIINNGEIISELKPIIPYVDLFDEYSLNTFINILYTYPRVKQRILTISQDYSLTSKFRDLITLANAYSSINDIHLFALTDKVVKILGEENSQVYLDFYLEMLKKKVCYIPPIYITDDNLIFYSGNYSDQDKLLIGKRYKDSCIDLDNIAGAVTFKECLIGKYGDVILVKTRDKKDFAGRILLVRRGNVVQLMVKNEDKFSVEVYKNIANEIIKQSELVDDNIEYVVINHKAISNTEDLEVLENIEYLTRFPHADLSPKVVLLASCQKHDMNFDLKPKHEYVKFRKKISYNPTDDEISRIRALNILLQDDIIIREELARNFEPFYSEAYAKSICGEEWYVARKITGELEEVILPNADIIAKKEFYEMRNMILTDDLKFNLPRK